MSQIKKPSMARKGRAPASTADQHGGDKSGDKSDRGTGRFENGDDRRRGRGPKKGAPNAGRPPTEFKLAMRGLASRKAVMNRLRQLTSGAKSVSDDVFLKAFKEVTDRGYGKAVQPLEHSGP